MSHQRFQSEVIDSGARARWATVDEEIWQRKSILLPENLSLKIAQTLLDQPRWLDARFLYDERGSELFEEICQLPEYYLTRTETSILKSHAAEIVETAGLSTLVEIGAGYSVKTRYLLKALEGVARSPSFVPVDISLSALRASQRMVLQEFPNVCFAGLHASYEDALTELRGDLPKLLVFLGSSVGNFMRADLIRFFDLLQRSMSPGDYLLLGVDQLKEPSLIEAAYNDSRGVTREFILNVFDSMNRQIGSDFDRNKFEYRPRYEEHWRQMEMYAQAIRPSRVRLPAPGTVIEWTEGEELLVEVSRKFDPARLVAHLRCFGMSLCREYHDPRQWFSLLLLKFEEVAEGK